MSSLKSGLQRAFLLVCVAAAFLAAAGVLALVGLPDRADFTGSTVNGLRIAPALNAFAPQIEQPTLSGDTADLRALQGDVVIVNFWATWCVPCRVEMPELQSLYEGYQDQGLHILAVNLGEPPELVQAWVDEFGLTFDIVLDASGRIEADYQLRSPPSTYVIDRAGIITRIFYGTVTEAILEEAISPLME